MLDYANFANKISIEDPDGGMVSQITFIDCHIIFARAEILFN